MESRMSLKKALMDSSTKSSISKQAESTSAESILPRPAISKSKASVRKSDLSQTGEPTSEATQNSSLMSPSLASNTLRGLYFDLVIVEENVTISKPNTSLKETQSLMNHITIVGYRVKSKNLT
jgi:hypothetical protein